MENTAKIGSQKLYFGNFAIRKFCRLQGCTNDPTTILSQFAGETRGDALFNIVQAGIETAYAEEKKPYDLDEFAISQFVDKLNVQEDKGDAVIFAFIGSVINKPAGEVPQWVKEVQKEADRLAAEEQKTAEVDPNPEAVGKTSPAGKTSKAAPTATA